MAQLNTRIANLHSVPKFHANEFELTPKKVAELIGQHEQYKIRYELLGDYYLGKHSILNRTLDSEKPNNKLVDKIKLASWLYKNFKLTVFIDSCIWGYANDLIKDLDNKYSKTGDNLYSYNKSLITASHVHMMLSAALTAMIDKTECLILLNTPNSVPIKDLVEKKSMTKSPWIYQEIASCQLMRRNKPKRFNLEKRALFENATEMVHTLNLKGFNKLNSELLDRWELEYNQRSNYNALDVLYNITP